MNSPWYESILFLIGKSNDDGGGHAIWVDQMNKWNAGLFINIRFNKEIELLLFILTFFLFE